MPCCKFQIQSHGIFWFLCPVYLVHIAVPAPSSTRRPSPAVFTLVIQRPRIAGGFLTIPLDSTVKLLPCFGTDADRNTIRLQYDSTVEEQTQSIVMCASSAAEREKWRGAITSAIDAAQDARNHVCSSSN
ncbi:uncharacterized protein IUM83_06256 [Phytophthora cinnamomi]|uniref:uncharacterized protein n=1 Tax=Phytophthora cinnamomi TaxID=4785 RepID=UPI00355A1A7F|nr:hypothetical protein IUM83_06256 [Phytophthora cinnamomi]